MYEYKTVIYRGGFLGAAITIFPTTNKNPVKFSELLNHNAREGWRVKAIEKDKKSFLLMFEREAYVVIMERKIDPARASL